jgi:hypothetical protein
MNYQLSLIDELVWKISQLTPENIDTTDDNVPVLQDLLQQLTHESTHIHQHLLREAFSVRKKKEMVMFIQNHQTAYIMLANKLYRYCYEILSFPFNEHTLHELIAGCMTAIDAIEKQLCFIEQHFFKYFDTNQLLPLHYFICARQTLFTIYKPLRQALDKKYSNEHAILSIACKPITVFVNANNEAQYTYGQLSYLNCLVRSLDRCMRDDDALTTTHYPIIMETLVKLNFNHPNFISYFLEYLKKENIIDTPLQEQIQCWLTHRKNIAAIPYETTQMLLPDQSPVKDALLYHIDEEIMVLENKIKHPSVVSETVLYKPKPFQCSLPIGQLAIFLRLLVETELVKPHNQREFLKQITALVQTDRASAISVESLRNKYYTPERSSLVSVKNLLFEFIKKIKVME